MAVVKNKKKRFNFVDVILLVIILAVISSLVYLVILAYNGHFFKGAQTEEIEYLLRVEGLDNDIRYTVNKGDRIVEIDGFNEIGTVTDVYEEDSEFVGYDAEGNVKVTKDPTKRDVILVIKAEANKGDSVYTIGSFELSVGSEIDFRTAGLVGSGQCVSLEVTGDE